MRKQQPNVKCRLDYLPPDFTITAIDLDFDLAPQKTKVIAVSHVIKKTPQASDLVLDGDDLTLVMLKVDGEAWTNYKIEGKQLIIYAVPDDFTLTIVNEICPAKNTALDGLYVSGDTLCTQCEAEGFRRITYYLDRPDVLATFRVKMTADKRTYPFMLSNGNRIAKGELPGGRHWITWYDPFPKPCYLFALVAGDFAVMSDTFVTRSHRHIDLEIYVAKGEVDKASWAMQSLKNAMKWDETRFGLEYDLDIFMIVAVDFFNMGAMENKGLNIFNAKYVLANPQTATDDDYLAIESVIGHEYFHNWTGNRVTCRDWFQLSLKEGLTVFRDQEFSADLGSRSVNRIHQVRVIRGAQFTEDASPMAHPIRPEKVIEMNNFYTVTVYEKGAEVIRMIHTLLGEQAFQAGMRCYFQRHDGTAATCDDFLQAMEAASGIDLTQFRDWYSQSGTPEVTVTSHYDADKKQYKLTVHQFTPETADQKQKCPLHFPLDIELYDKEGQVIPLQYKGQPVLPKLHITAAEQTFLFDTVPNKPVISLLRAFSAPVKLHYHYRLDELFFLMRHATDDFSRYDAAQRLYYHHILQNMKNLEVGKAMAPMSEDMINALRGVLCSKTADPALIALILTLPSENDIANQVTIIHPDIINKVRVHFIVDMANAMSAEWLATYKANPIAQYRILHGDMALRSLKNTALFYLGHHANGHLANPLLHHQYFHSDNMTDKLAALSVAVSAQLSCADELMRDFDHHWHTDGLVMDKWFVLQATSPHPNVLQKVKKLLSHRSFSMNNPNRIRSLIGAFVTHNPVAFHAKNGEGYRFLTTILTELNQKNPQIAARMIDPLLRFGHYDNGRQQHMTMELKKLRSLTQLADGLYEKINRALEGQVVEGKEING